MQPQLPPISDADADADSVGGVHGGRSGWPLDDDDEDDLGYAGSHADDEYDDEYTAGGGSDFRMYAPRGTTGSSRTAPPKGTGKPAVDPTATEMQPPKPTAPTTSSLPQPRSGTQPPLPSGYNAMDDEGYGLDADDDDDEDDDLLSGSIGSGLIDEAEKTQRVELVMSMGFDLTEAQVRAKLQDAFWDVELVMTTLLSDP